MLMFDQNWLNLAVALGIGLLIGIERERRKGEGPARASAGVRTFAVVALLGAVSVLLGGEMLLAAAALGVALLTAIAYWRRREEDPGLTTEAALLLTLLLGGLALREPALASALGVALAVLLFARSHMHHFARNLLTEQEVHDGLILAAAALVVLPLIPDRYLGPYDAINPRTIWTIVVLMMSIGAAGHVAMRLLGPRYGLPLSGLASGFVSSIATIGAMGARVARNPGLLRPATAGAVLSTVATMVQMMMVLAATSMAVLQAMLPALICAGIVATAYGAFYMVLSLRSESVAAAESGQAFSIRTALLLAAGIAVILLLAAAFDDMYGAGGLAAVAALSGFADTHSTAVSVASLSAAGRLQAQDAVIPILVGLSTNTLSKAAIAWAGGNRAYALSIIPGLALTLLAAWAGAWWGATPG
jgi:uncharacterized membrane protein (DUF4010 family)